MFEPRHVGQGAPQQKSRTDLVLQGWERTVKTDVYSAVLVGGEGLEHLPEAKAKAFGINNLFQVVGCASSSGDTILHAFRTAPNCA